VTVPDTTTSGRADIATASRVVVKVGSSSLTTPDGEIDGDRIETLTAALAARRQEGGQVVLVSSGAIASGLAPLGLSRRPRDLATQQAAASVGQGLLIARYTAAFARHGIRTGQVLLSADDLMRRTHYRNAQRTLDRLLELGVIMQPTSDRMCGLKIKPPLCLDIAGADFFADALDRVLTEGW